jgi:hypothetical protein
MFIIANDDLIHKSLANNIIAISEQLISTVLQITEICGQSL